MDLRIHKANGGRAELLLVVRGSPLNQTGNPEDGRTQQPDGDGGKKKKNKEKKKKTKKKKKKNKKKKTKK